LASVTAEQFPSTRPRDSISQTPPVLATERTSNTPSLANTPSTSIVPTSRPMRTPQRRTPRPTWKQPLPSEGSGSASTVGMRPSGAHDSYKQALPYKTVGGRIFGDEAVNRAPESSNKPFEGHLDVIYGVAFINDRLAVSGSDDKTLRLWDVATGKETL